MSFGQRLQDVRKRNCLTQEMFAEQLHVSRQAVSRWESDRGYPEIEKLLYLCRTYGVTLDELFSDELPDAVHQSGSKPSEDVPPIRGKHLRRAVDDFLSNLSPYDKLVGGVLFSVALLALMAIGRSMRGGDSNMSFIWILAIIVFGVAEAATAGLVSIWFVAGSMAGLVAAEFGAPFWLQVVLFLLVSVAALAVTRPIAHKLMDKSIVPTNADRVLHRRAKVVEPIDNENERGAVYIDGLTWTARSESGAIIHEGAMVTIVKMEGVKLFVREEKEEI